MQSSIHKYRHLIMGVGAAIIAYAVAIGLAYYWPPLTIIGGTQGLGTGGVPALGVDLFNASPLAVRLTAVRAPDADQPERALVVWGDPVSSNHALVFGLDSLERAPVKGWLLRPMKRQEGDDAGLYLEWAPGARLPDQVVVSYRYLGWPMQAVFKAPFAWERFTALALAAPTAADGQALIKDLCTPGPDAGPDLEAKVLAEIRRLVTTYGSDSRTLQEQLVRAFGTEPEPAALVGDLDGDAKPDAVVGFGRCGGPALVYLTAGGSDQPVRLPTGEEAAVWRYLQGNHPDRIADVNGDGRPELVLEHTVAGGSADTTDLYIYQWQGGQFQVLFHDMLNNWRGANQWSVSDGAVSIQCRPLGPFEHKLSPSRQQTERFRWNPDTLRYELAERTREPITTRLQAVAEAEELFQTGSYADAFTAYSQVARFQPQPQEVDWVAFAALRMGQIEALAGRRDEALSLLGEAVAGAEPVGEMARLFRATYDRAGAAEAFQAVWQWVRTQAYDSAGVLKADWPNLFDPHTAGARSAMIEAYRQAGATAPALPEERKFEAPACLTIVH